MSEIEHLCGEVGIYLGSLKKLVERIAEAYSQGLLKKSDRQSRHGKTTKSLQEILGYGNYNTFRKYLLFLTLSGVDLGEFDSRLSGLRMKVFGIGFGHCELTAIEDETLELQDSLMKNLEHLLGLRIALFPEKPILRMREGFPFFGRSLERVIRRRRFLFGGLLR